MHQNCFMQFANELKTFFFHTTTLERLAPLNFTLDNVLPLHIAIPTLIEPSYSKNKDHLCIVNQRAISNKGSLYSICQTLNPLESTEEAAFHGGI